MNHLNTYVDVEDGIYHLRFQMADGTVVNLMSFKPNPPVEEPKQETEASGN